MLNLLWITPVVSSIGSVLLKILILVLILGVIILVHEFGHFIWAKKFGVHIYEFSIGMGPLLFTHKGKKDKIDYNIRAIPIGGYVAMAGEVYDDDDKVDKKSLMCNKPWWQRLIILCAGVFNNFIMAIVLLIVYAAIWGGSAITPTISYVKEKSAFDEAGIVSGDTIVSINGHKANTWDKALIILNYKNKNKDNSYVFEIKHEDGKKEKYTIIPKTIKDEATGEETSEFGVQIANTDTKGVWRKFAYGFRRFASIWGSMNATIWGLITGKISLSALSGPVGMYSVVGETLNYSLGMAIEYVIYLIILLSVNVGYINILPFPAFDGGHVLFVLIEKIKGSPINSKIENAFHIVGFALILLLMIVVTISDIIKLV